MFVKRDARNDWWSKMKSIKFTEREREKKEVASSFKSLLYALLVIVVVADLNELV